MKSLKPRTEESLNKFEEKITLRKSKAMKSFRGILLDIFDTPGISDSTRCEIKRQYIPSSDGKRYENNFMIFINSENIRLIHRCILSIAALYNLIKG